MKIIAVAPLILLMTLAVSSNFSIDSAPAQKSASEIWDIDQYLNETYTVDEGETLIIEPGVTIYLEENVNIIVKGTLKAEGTEDEVITFTRWNTTYWGSIRIFSPSTDSVIKHCKIEYAGWPEDETYGAVFCGSEATISNNVISNSEDCGINCQISSVTISYNTISNNVIGIFCLQSSPEITYNTIISNNQQGIWCKTDSSPTISHNDISNNMVGVYCWAPSRSYASLPTIHYNNIYSNSEYGVENDNPGTGTVVGTSIDAENNWWGSSAGPGSERVSEGVDYEPYLTEKTGITPPNAVFTYSPSSPKTGDVVQFTDASTDDVLITSRSWDFGDGNTTNEENPTHSYIKAGTYNVTLTVTDNDDMVDFCSKSITIILSGSDYDNDSIPDDLDDDKDGDGVPNDEDYYPLDSSRWEKEEKQKEKEFIPGFEGMLLLLAIGVSAVLFTHRKK